jgi:hypothetical protein
VFRRLVDGERELLDDHESHEGAERDLFVFGRHRGREDTRVIALVLARHVLDDD